jgi:hypothetical protein
MQPRDKASFGFAERKGKKQGRLHRGVLAGAGESSCRPSLDTPACPILMQHCSCRVHFAMGETCAQSTALILHVPWQVREKHLAVFEGVQSLFHQRPSWLYPDVCERMATRAEAGRLAALDVVLGVLTYRFNAGPWRPALILRGCDPRKDAKFWQYQVLMFTLPDSWKGSLVHQELDAMAGCVDTPWTSMSMPGQQHAQYKITTEYKQLIALSSIPPTKVSYFQVLCAIVRVCQSTVNWHCKRSLARLLTSRQAGKHACLLVASKRAVHLG